MTKNKYTFIILGLVVFMSLSHCIKDTDLNPYTTIIKYMVKGNK